MIMYSVKSPHTSDVSLCYVYNSRQPTISRCRCSNNRNVFTCSNYTKARKCCDVKFSLFIYTENFHFEKHVEKKNHTERISDPVPMLSTVKSLKNKVLIVMIFLILQIRRQRSSIQWRYTMVWRCILRTASVLRDGQEAGCSAPSAVCGAEGCWSVQMSGWLQELPYTQLPSQVNGCW